MRYIIILVLLLSGCSRVEHVPMSEYKMVSREFVVNTAQCAFVAGYRSGADGNNIIKDEEEYLESINGLLELIWRDE